MCQEQGRSIQVAKSLGTVCKTSTKRRYNGRYTSCLKTLQEQGGKYQQRGATGKGRLAPHLQYLGGLILLSIYLHSYINFKTKNYPVP